MDSKLLEIYRPNANILKVFVSHLAGNYLSSLSHSPLSAVSEKKKCTRELEKALLQLPSTEVRKAKSQGARLLHRGGRCARAPLDLRSARRGWDPPDVCVPTASALTSLYATIQPRGTVFPRGT